MKEWIGRKGLTRLRWNVPHSLPHGPLGCALISSGGYEMWDAFHGNLCSPQLGVLIGCLTVANAYSGIKLLSSSSSSSITSTSRMFHLASLFQYCVSYEMVRFSLPFQSFLNQYLFCLDASCGILFVYTFLSMIRTVLEIESIGVKFVVCVGVLMASSFTFYPLQIGFFTSSWIDSISSYSNQEMCMATFVYAPTCVSVSLIMFFATLYGRKIIKDRELSFLSFSLPILLICTVLCQDGYFGDTSTQQLILGLPESDITPFVKWFDIRSFLS